MKFENETKRKLRNLQEMIVSDAYKRKEKVIAIDSETFKEIKGKEVRLRISSKALEAMKEELSE